MLTKFCRSDFTLEAAEMNRVEGIANRPLIQAALNPIVSLVLAGF